MTTLLDGIIADPASATSALSTAVRFDVIQAICAARQRIRVDRSPGVRVALGLLVDEASARLQGEPYVTAPLAAALLDLGRANDAEHVLRRALEAGETSFYVIRVLARMARERGRGEHAAYLHEVANQAEDWIRYRLPPATVSSFVRAALAIAPRNWIRGDVVLHELSVGARPLRLHGTINIPGLPDHRIRGLDSRQQVDRAAHHLQNCLSSMWPDIKTGRRWVLTLEQDGTPREAIEVSPHDGRIVQWQGARRVAPNPATTGTVLDLLVRHQLARPQGYLPRVPTEPARPAVHATRELMAC